MAGSIYGNLFRVSTWGETHGKGVGVVIDGCPAGLTLCEEDIQVYLDRRKPGQSKFTTMRKEGDLVEILSGVFEGKTTGTPISLLVWNQDHRSKDYGNIKDCYRPGHADYTFDAKYGFRDYRGGGRSSGRETIARVAAGAVAAKILREFGIEIFAYSRAIGPVKIEDSRFDRAVVEQNSFYMPDAIAAEEAAAFVEEKMKECDSVGGVVECIAEGLPAGLGEPVFDKLDACLAQAVMSIGAVKGVEIGDGFGASSSIGSEFNDAFYQDGASVAKKTNHAGGILGGISDGSQVIIRAAFKPTPSIAKEQNTVNREGEEIPLVIHGRHDPIVVPRAVVVIEAMTAITILDQLMRSMTSRLDDMKRFFSI